MYRSKRMIYIIVFFAATLLGVRSATADCNSSGVGLNNGCYTLGSCGVFSGSCTKVSCWPGENCPVSSVLECNYWGCMFASDCEFCI